jgi:hypothetical protein
LRLLTPPCGQKTETVRFLKTAELRIAELEVQVSALEKKVAKNARMKPVPTAESENADD